MAKMTREERWRLRGREIKPRDSTLFACPEKAPGAGSYPIHDVAHAVSAVSYYQRPGYQRCRGGQKRICSALKRFGYSSAATEDFCKGRLEE